MLINRNAYLAARKAVDCAPTAAEQILGGYRFAYALIRPPGHHAERRAFGGFCYFNPAVVAAQHLSKYGKIVILGIDFHLPFTRSWRPKRPAQRAGPIVRQQLR
jgi:acetoin utilization deacetylase AcuC-like enzyme